jgi:hypothetical protein
MMGVGFEGDWMDPSAWLDVRMGEGKKGRQSQTVQTASEPCCRVTKVSFLCILHIAFGVP